MKVSEAIKKLQEIEREEGDIDFMIGTCGIDGDFDYVDVEKLDVDVCEMQYGNKPETKRIVYAGIL